MYWKYRTYKLNFAVVIYTTTWQFDRLNISNLLYDLIKTIIIKPKHLRNVSIILNSLTNTEVNLTGIFHHDWINWLETNSVANRVLAQDYIP